MAHCDAVSGLSSGTACPCKIVPVRPVKAVARLISMPLLDVQATTPPPPPCSPPPIALLRSSNTSSNGATGPSAPPAARSRRMMPRVPCAAVAVMIRYWMLYTSSNGVLTQGPVEVVLAWRPTVREGPTVMRMMTSAHVSMTAFPEGMKGKASSLIG